MQRITTIDDFLTWTGDDAPTAAERTLITACRQDGTHDFGPRPTEPDPKVTLRADLLRHLITGGTPACGLHPSGLRLKGAWIAGQLDLSFLQAVGQTVVTHCHFDMAPQFPQTRFHLLNLEYCHLPGLSAQRMDVTGSTVLRNLISTGTVDVAGSTIGGQLSCTDAILDGAGKKALNAQGVRVARSISFQGLTAKGTVAVNGAEIGGQLTCSGANLDGVGQKALNAQGVQVAAELFLRKLTATGTVDVNGATVGGQMSCIDANLDGAGKSALFAQGLQVSASLLLGRLTAKGTVAVNGATIGGQLSCKGANLDGAGQKAFYAQGVQVEASLFLSEITAIGTVSVNGARIGGQVSFTGASLNGDGEKALHAQGLHVGQGFYWRDLVSVQGPVSLRSAHVGDLVDDMTSWPNGADQVILDGFTYDRIGGSASTSTMLRLQWLATGARYGGTFFPQPYTQLATVLAASGHDRQARKVLAERERILAHEARRATRIAPNGDVDVAFASLWADIRILLSWTWDLALRHFAGYGYAPHYALFWALGFIALAAIGYSQAWHHGLIVPNSDVILTSAEWHLAMALGGDTPSQFWSDHLPAARHYETFYGLAYALDVFTPILSLGQEAAWSQTTVTPMGVAARVATYALNLLGWFLTALGAAAVTGLIQKKRD